MKILSKRNIVIVLIFFAILAGIFYVIGTPEKTPMQENPFPDENFSPNDLTSKWYNHLPTPHEDDISDLARRLEDLSTDCRGKEFRDYRACLLSKIESLRNTETNAAMIDALRESIQEENDNFDLYTTLRGINFGMYSPDTTACYVLSGIESTKVRIPGVKIDPRKTIYYYSKQPASDEAFPVAVSLQKRHIINDMNLFFGKDFLKHASILT